MNKEAAIKEIQQIIAENPVGVLSTIQANKPNARYMTFFQEDLTIYTPTSKETHKAKEIEDNPHVHIILGYNGNGYEDGFIEVSGTATLKDDQNLKDKLWTEHSNKWFSGKDDPNYVVLEINPTEIRLLNDGNKEPISIHA